jgi:hypothetical protein
MYLVTDLGISLELWENRRYGAFGCSRLHRNLWLSLYTTTYASYVNYGLCLIQQIRAFVLNSDDSRVAYTSGLHQVILEAQ